VVEEVAKEEAEKGVVADEAKMKEERVEVMVEV